jgi:hypothetical protein
MYFEITAATYIKDYLISLTFRDGKQGVVDLSSYSGYNDVFSPFSDLSFFKSFVIEYGTLVWGNGQVDIAPETLYQKALNL